MHIIEATFRAAEKAAKQKHIFLEANGVTKENINNFIIKEDVWMDLTTIKLYKRPNFMQRTLWVDEKLIATVSFSPRKYMEEFLESKKPEKVMATAVENIKAGDLVELDTKTGQIKKVKNQSFWVTIEEAAEALKTNFHKRAETAVKNRNENQIKKKSKWTASACVVWIGIPVNHDFLKATREEIKKEKHKYKKHKNIKS